VRDALCHAARLEITGAADGIDDEDLIEREDMVVTVTIDGYIKRTPLSTFRAQNRGGKGRAGMATKEEDAVPTMFVTSTHTPVLFFSTAGKVYRLKVWRLPEGGPPRAAGRSSTCCPALDKGETIATVLPLPEDEAEWGKLHVVFATAKGNVRRNSMDAFTNIPSNGKFAMRFEDDSDDRLIGVALLDAERRRAARIAARARRSALPATTCASSRAAPPPACAACAEGRRRSDFALDPAPRRHEGPAEEREEYLRFAPGRARRKASRNCRPNAMPKWPRASSSSSPSAPTAMASCRRPMNIAAPDAVARASPISTISAATARSSPVSRPRPISSCSSPIRPS
jgi:DNA gyrase subunit A